jgi:cell division protein ZapA
VERIKTTVRIAGREYTMTGTDPEEHIHRVAAYVDRRMEELALATRLPSNMIPVLAAMNATDELLKAQDENSRLKRDVAQLQQQLAKLRAAQGGTEKQYGKGKGAKHAPPAISAVES